LLISLWNVGGAFVKPNGILRNSNCPSGVVKVVYRHRLCLSWCRIFVSGSSFLKIRWICNELILLVCSLAQYIVCLSH